MRSMIRLIPRVGCNLRAGFLNMKIPMRKWLEVALVWVLAGTGAVYAQSDAYSIEVAVFDRSVEEQTDAYVAGLRRVLLSNSGDKTLLNRDDIRQGLSEADRFVQSFSYRTPEAGTVIDSSTPITRKVQQTGQATQLMFVRFDRNQVDSLISTTQSSSDSAGTDDTQAQQSDSRSPNLRLNSALVWLLIKDENRDILISDPVAVNVQSRAREIAGAAGISLVYPTGDEEDRSSLSNEDIIAQDGQSIASASARYRQDVILSGYLSRIGARGWRGEWIRLLGEQQQQHLFETSSLDEALQLGLNVLSAESGIDERFRYGGSATSETEALVWVGSMDSTTDYARMMKFFQELPTVSTVYAKEIQQTSIVFSVVPRSALNEIESAVFNAAWLQRSSVPVGNQPNSLARNADLAIEYDR